jgi:DNA-binding response OmpR family regulator
VHDRVAGLTLGGTKPFSLDEVLLRLRPLSFSKDGLVAVSSLEQDQSVWQIEYQNRAREGLSRACVLVCARVSQSQRGLPAVTEVDGGSCKEKVYGSIP